MKLFRTRYKFTHPNEDTPVYFKARSESAARDKFSVWVAQQLYGKWALSYNRAKVMEIVEKCNCEVV